MRMDQQNFITRNINTVLPMAARLFEARSGKLSGLGYVEMWLYLDELVHNLINPVSAGAHRPNQISYKIYNKFSRFRYNRNFNN